MAGSAAITAVLLSPTDSIARQHAEGARLYFSSYDGVAVELASYLAPCRGKK